MSIGGPHEVLPPHASFEVTQACYQTRRGDVLLRHCR